MDGTLDAKFEERQMIRRAEMWTHIAAIRSLGRKVHAHIYTHNLGVLDGLPWRRSMSARRSRMPICRKGFGRSKKKQQRKE